MEAVMLLFKKYGLTLGLIGGAVALVLIFLIYLISIIFNKPINFAIGPIKLNLKGRSKKNDGTLNEMKNFLEYWEGTDTGHQSVIVDVVKTVEEKTMAKDIIRYKETVTKQMVVAEECNIKIKALLVDSYVEKLNEKTEDTVNANQHRDYKFYRVIVSSILDDIKRDILKESLKNTNILKLSDAEFDAFVKHKSDVMVIVINEYLEFMNNGKSMVSQKELQKINKSLDGEIRLALKEMYEQIKIIIETDKETIDKISIEMDTNIDVLKKKMVDGCVIKNLMKLIEKGDLNEIDPVGPPKQSDDK